MAIAPLSSSARDYVRAFDLTAICQWRDGRIGVSRNPTGADQAWWCPAKATGKIVRAANANGRDITKAAAGHRVALTPHVVVVQRVGEAVGRIDGCLKAAQLRGDLAYQLYKARRAAAQAHGRGFMSYAQASRRLRKAVASAAANGEVLSRSLMLSVFGE
jgi:hypothetical protein